MELQHTYKLNGRDAFTINYKCIKLEDGLFKHELISTLPEQCLNYVHSNYFMRMTEDYRPTTTEACKMLDKLSQEVFNVEQFQPFYFPEYMLVNGDIEPQQLSDLLRLQKKFKFNTGEHFSVNTRSTEFAVLVKETYRFKIFYKKNFQRRFLPISRTKFEECLLPGRAALDYIQLYKPSNVFFVMSQDNTQFYYLCNATGEPEMIITIINSLFPLKNKVGTK